MIAHMGIPQNWRKWKIRHQSCTSIQGSESNINNTEIEHFEGEFQQEIHLADRSIIQSSENAEPQRKRSYNKTKEVKQKRKKSLEQFDSWWNT